MLKKRIAVIFFVLAFTVCLFSSIAASAAYENEAETIIVEATQPTTDTSHLLDESRDVKLNISAVDAEYNPISDVRFEIYRISEDFTADKSSIDINSIDKSKLMLIRLPATGADGKTSITLSPDKRGVYIVSCVFAPESVKEKPSDFLVSLPYTSEDGSEWLYELDQSPKLVMNIETQPTKPTETTEPETETAVTSGIGSGIDTNGNGNGINTNESKGNINTGEIATGVCLAAAVVLFSAGVILTVKSKGSEQG